MRTISADGSPALAAANARAAAVCSGSVRSDGAAGVDSSGGGGALES
jgi:hypothetical protein